MAVTAIGTACDEPCNLQKELRVRAGAAAVDCGHVPLGGNRSATDACVLQAFMNERAFTARCALQGIDSTVALGVVGTADGSAPPAGRLLAQRVAIPPRPGPMAPRASS